MAQRWLHRIRDQGKVQQIRWRDMEVLVHCGLVFMSVAHLTSTTLFVPKLDVMYLGLAVVIWLATLSTILGSVFFLCCRMRARKGIGSSRCCSSASKRQETCLLRGYPIITIILWSIATIQSLDAALFRQYTCPDDHLGSLWATVGGCIMPRVYTGSCAFTAILASVLLRETDRSRKSCTEKCSAFFLPNGQQEREIEANSHESYADQPSVTQPTPPSPVQKNFRPNSQETVRAWLPPLQFQLVSPSTEDPTELKLHSELSLARRRTCDTSSSSRYSRRSASLSSLSQHPSTRSSLSDQSINSRTRITSVQDNQKVSRPALPAIPDKYLHPSHGLNSGSRPVRPGSRPAMPPAEFWEYADKQRVRNTYVSISDSHNIHDSTMRTGKREPSVCRYPILATPAMPVCRTRRATVHSETAHIKNPSYESVRKGPLDNTNKLRSMTPLGEIGATDGSATDEHRRECSTKARPKHRESRTLIKQRQPSRK
ncbi:MAG: hypothetical protein LQ349_006170 [Xanthoria aureola]|nr:MAG: hypothetical protein LQ349_006170 [Xanthoria aureola]